MGTGISLLLTLLATDDANKEPLTIYALTQQDGDMEVPLGRTADVDANIAFVVNNIKPLQSGGTPNLIKDVARKELYEVLYSIIEKEYEDAPVGAPPDPLNQTLNSAIGMALERAICGELKDNTKIQILRKELRKKILKALTPQ